MKIVLVSIFSLAMVLSWSPLAAGQAGSNSLDYQLISAAYNGDTTVVQQLLEKGANIEAKDNDGDTALKAAERKGNTEIVKLLREKGAR